MQLAIKNRVRVTPPTFMCDAQIENQGNRSHIVNQVGGKLNGPSGMSGLRAILQTGKSPHPLGTLEHQDIFFLRFFSFLFIFFFKKLEKT